MVKSAAALLALLTLVLGLAGPGTAPAAAADPTASLSIQKAASDQTVQPGQTFTYTIQLQCTAGTVNGCVNAKLDDPMPPYITIVGTPTVTGTANFDASATTSGELAVTFTDNLGGGQQGLAPGNVVVIQVQVKVDDDAPPTADGQTLPNTATVTADNANTKQGSADVTLDVPETLAATTTKTISPSGGPNTAGSTTAATVSGTNTSNVPVHQMVISDPVLDSDGNPPASGDPFQYLELSGLNSVTYPTGADTAQVRVYDSSTGAWVDGPVANAPADPTLPAGVDPADVTGVQLIFTSTSDPQIPPGASAGVSFELALREAIPEGQLPLVITNVADTTVIDDDGTSATSDPASATYRIPPNDVDVSAGKSFDPKVVHVGDTSTVTLSGTNESADPLDSMTITEPAAGTPNHLADGGLAFTSMGSPAGSGVVWPDGATGASITYVCDGTAIAPIDATTPNTLPAPPASCDPVTGFSVTFTGSISPGAQATIPFVVTTATDQGPEELIRTNTVGVEGERDGNTGNATHTAIIETIKDRIDVDVDKTLIPSTIPSFPGQIVTAELSGQLLPFPDSTVDATTIVVQDPAQFPDPNDWYDSFNPQAVTATPVPACASMTVEYTTDEGGSWTPVPGMDGIAGATIFNGAIPDDIGAAADGIRFVYTAAPAGGGCSGGFPPGTSVSPNLSYTLDEDAPNAQLDPLTDCAASSGTSPTTPDAHSAPACDDVDFTPVDAGSVDPIDKAWDQDSVIERSQAQAGATLSWSTNGYTGVGRIDITDTENPDTTPLPQSVFDTFDLARIDPITAEDDPLLTYDQITKVQLYELPAGSTDPAAGAWVDAPGDPCPAACDGTFPGYTLSAADRAVTIGFRLTYIESPTRADRLSTPSPAVGSGVAASTGNNRHIHPVFQLRDVRRSDPSVPVTAGQLYNTADPGLVDNTVRLDPYWNVEDPDPILSKTDADTILITNVDVTVDGTKTWDGGPLGIPEAGVPQDEYPTSRVTVTASNTTPSKIDELTLTEPDTSNQGGGSCTTSPFDQFNLAGFTTITPPADIGATDVTITLLPGPGGKTDYTRDEALALTEADLTNVTSMKVAYTGRIDAATDTSKPTATVTFDVRLRTANRSDGSAPQTGTVCDQVHVTAADMVDFPTYLDQADAYRQADIDLVNQGIDVAAGKAFDPTSITEPSHGPVKVTLGGRPSGASRTVKMVLEDTSPTFFNQYDFASFEPIVWVNPVNRVQVEVYIGGTWSINGGGDPVLTGGHWETGPTITAPDTALSLPSGVTPAQVQGVRFTFTKSDGSNWENPANPTQTASFDVNRRDTLNTGGPVPSDLTGSTPAPGETVAGDATDTTTATVTSSDKDAAGNPLTDSDTADATVHYRHANNAVQIRKTPNGDTEAPGVPFKYTVTVKNTGNVDVTNPVITDVFPSDAQGPQIELAPDPNYSFAIAGGTGMPTDPADVTTDASATGIVFTFPDGSTLPVGATYTISFSVVTRPGLAAGTEFTNTVGVTGDRPWDACDNGGSNTVDPSTGQCRTTATDTVISAGAVAISKQVKAEGSDVLGVAIDPLFVTRPAVNCVPNAAGFYTRPCIPIAQPGGAITWRWHFVNAGNLPLDRVLGIDRLPAPGDTVGTAPDLPRLSQWQPLLTGSRPELADAPAGTFRVYYTTATSGWCDGPQAQDGQLLCPALNWQEWTAGETLDDLGVDPATVTGLQTELLPDTPLAPAGTFNVDLAMSAPAYSVADRPNTDAMSESDTYAFNSVGTAGRYISGATRRYTLTTEPPRVGVGLAHGGLRVEKTVQGDAAGQFAPESFAATLSCVSAGERVPLRVLPDRYELPLTLRADQPITVYDLPYHATCTLSEGDNGQTSSSSTSAVVQRDVGDFETATLTNTYEYASLAVTKKVDSAAVDQDGKPIPYGPFTVTVTCTYRGEPDYAEGYGPDNPMTADLSDGQTVTFVHLHPDATCEIGETDDKGAASTTIVTTPASGDPDSTDGTTSTIELDPDSGAHPPNTATITNTFDVGSINVIKKVTGDVADRYGAGPFTVAMKCVLDDASGARTVWDDTIELGGGSPLHATVTDLAAGATCTVTEPDTAGASTVTIEPTGPIPVDANETATVTVTNSFDPAKLYVDKKLDGAGASSAPSSFTVEVTCSAGGEVLAGFPVTVHVSPGTPAEVDTLAGAECSARETDSGGATEVTYDPAVKDGSDRSGTVVVTGDAQRPITITITNTFTGGAPSGSDSSGSGSSGGGSSGGTTPAQTGVPVGRLLLLALLLALSGAALTAFAGRRRHSGRHGG